MNDFNENLINQKMDKAIISYQNDLNGIRAGRASINMLDTIKVDVYGNKTSLNQVGNISVPEARLITISIWDANNVSIVEKAIRESNLGLNPMTEGNLIRVPIPALSEERRKELLKVAAQIAENSKIAIRNIRRDIIEDIRKSHKNNEISDDEKHQNENVVQKVTDDFINNIDKILENTHKKTSELLIEGNKTYGK